MKKPKDNDTTVIAIIVTIVLVLVFKVWLQILF